LPIRAKDYTSVALVNVSAAVQLIAGFEVSINCRFWVSTEENDRDKNRRHPTSHAASDSIVSG